MVTASPNSQRHTYSYDGIGTRRSLDASSAGRFTSAYDLAGQLTSLRNPYSERTTFSYDDSGRRTVQRNANGTRVSTVYDAASQTSQVIHRPAAGSPLLQLDYRYDNAGNRKVLIEGGGTARVTWSYDAQNQLTGEHRTGTNAYRQTYTFDPAGNRTLKNLGGTRTTYGYDSANQLRYGQAVAGRTTFQYDLTGNQRIEQPPTGNRTTTTWNYENQPTQYRLPTGSPVTMAYNGDNRRISLQQGSTTTKFVWDSVIDAYVKELDGSNIVQAVYTSEPQHYGAVLSQRRGSTSHVLHADALGTTRLLTTSAGASSDTYLFDAWGNLITSSGTTVNPFRWVGRYGYYMDQSTGMVYVRARMYQPTVARWVSVDPMGQISWHNPFAYVSNMIILRGAYFVRLGDERIDLVIKPRCTFKVCSSPIQATDNAGHFFIICDRLGMRAGPLRQDQDPKWPYKRDCKCNNVGLGRLVPTIEPWDENFIDHPLHTPRDGKPYGEEKLICRDITVEGKCVDVCDCLRSVFDALGECCVDYEAVPERQTLPVDEPTGNSNSAVVWALKLCTSGYGLFPDLPKDRRVNPGGLQLVPKCIREKKRHGKFPTV